MACTRVKAQKSVANLGRVRMTTMVNNKKKEKNWNHNAARLDIDTALAWEIFAGAQSSE